MVAPNETVPAFVIGPVPVVVLLKPTVVPATVVTLVGITVAALKLTIPVPPVVVVRVEPAAPV